MQTDAPKVGKEDVEQLFDARFIRVFDMQYKPGRHYYNAIRRSIDDLVAIKTDDEFKSMTADAVSCLVIIDSPGDDPYLLLTREFRYPTGRFLLSVPAGLIDPEDRACKEPALAAARREIREETGLVLEDSDTLTLVSPLVFSSPGMTDESNALVCAVIHSEQVTPSTDGLQGHELFDGFVALNKTRALQMLKRGKDEDDGFYSVYTWMALAFFAFDMWK
jgi:ADP-ribose pyrophosphatase